MRILAAALIAGALLLTTATPALALSHYGQRKALLSYANKSVNLSLRYLHTTWFKKLYRYSTAVATPIVPGDEPTRTIELLVPKGGFSAGEVPVRSQASALYATAIALRQGFYRSEIVLVNSGQARRRTVAWTNALARSYGHDHWATGWQSPLWVYYLGFGAKQVWTSLPQQTQRLVTGAVAAEANRLLAIPPPYYRDASGTIIYSGDTKSEEDGWNGNLLLFAAREFPDNPNAASWEAQGRWYAIASYASPSQIGTDPRIGGSNISDVGTLINHGRLHPDYMFSHAEWVAKPILFALDTDSAVPTETANNFRLVWSALTRLRFTAPQFEPPGGTIYRRDGHGAPNANLYYPRGNDRGTQRRFNAAQTDVEAFGANIDPDAYRWASAHLRFVLSQQARHRDGSVFSRGETTFKEDEQFAAASAAEMTWRLRTMR